MIDEADYVFLTWNGLSRGVARFDDVVEAMPFPKRVEDLELNDRVKMENKLNLSRLEWFEVVRIAEQRTPEGTHREVAITLSKVAVNEEDARVQSKDEIHLTEMIAQEFA